MSINRWVDIALLVGGLLWASVYLSFADDVYVVEHFAPPALALVMYSVNALLVVLLRDAVLKVIGMIWVIWPVAGTYFSVAHFYQRKLWASLDLSQPDLIFTSGTLAMLLGLHLFSTLMTKPREPTERAAWRPLDVLPLLVYPPLYAVVLTLTGGTILSGGSLIDSMYSIERGPIYGMRIALVPTMGFLALFALSARGRAKLLVQFYIFFSLFVSVLDGKRDMALLGFLAILFVMLSSQVLRARGGRVVAMLLVVAFSYGALSNLRSQRDVEFDTWTSFASIAGIEYRDFAHTVNYWSPEYMETLNYDFVKSSLGALINGDVLAVFGVDKFDLIQQDSARAWQRASLSQFGIRTGLVSELYFGLPNAWFLLLAGFGASLGALRRWSVQAQGELGQVMAITALSAATLAVFSQTSATLGFVMSLIYITAALIFWRLFLHMTPLAARR